MAELILKDCTKQYQKVTALDGFDYTFTPGIYGLLGENGAGKSTLMNLITDNIARTRGTILWDGQEILKLGASFRRQVGYMPQQGLGFGELTIQGFLQYIGSLKGMKKLQIRQESQILLEQLNLTKHKDKRMGALSGGLRQRAMLAQAMLGDPSILLLDEPTAGLDPQERIRIRNMISVLARDRIILLATHIVSDVESIAQEVLLMRGGKLIKSGRPAKLIGDVKPYIVDVPCTRQELAEWQAKHPLGRVLQREDHLYYRYLSDQPEHGSIADADLEDVYMHLQTNVSAGV